MKSFKLKLNETVIVEDDNEMVCKYIVKARSATKDTIEYELQPTKNVAAPFLRLHVDQKKILRNGAGWVAAIVGSQFDLLVSRPVNWWQEFI